MTPLWQQKREAEKAILDIFLARYDSYTEDEKRNMLATMVNNCLSLMSLPRMNEWLNELKYYDIDRRYK